jgi:hypothetical protein
MIAVKKPRKTAFDLYYYFLGIHSIMVYKDTRLLRTKQTTGGKSTFNAKIQHIKDQFGIDSKDTNTVKDCIMYMYLHDPLHRELKYYGNVAAISKAMPHYLYWRENNAELIEELGSMKAIVLTSPRDDGGELFDDLMHEMMGSLKKGL